MVTRDREKREREVLLIGGFGSIATVVLQPLWVDELIDQEPPLLPLGLPLCMLIHPLKVDLYCELELVFLGHLSGD